jgi:hypothetical protein
MVADRSEPRTVWFDEPMRWLHLNLVGDDPLHADVRAWAQYWAEARVDGVTISAAGATAYYPTNIPDHPRAAMPNGRDLFRELVAAAKKLNMRVLARFEPTNISGQQVEAHPDWPVRNADGTPRSTSDPRAVGIRDNIADASAFASLAGTDRYAPCLNGPYFRFFIPAVMTELAQSYPIDGYYANGWPRLGAGPPQEGAACHCDACLTAWQSRGPGHEAVPDTADPDDPLWRDYVAFIQDTVEDVQRRWQEHARSLRPGLTFVCNLFGSLASGLRWERFRHLVDVFVHDGQGRTPIGPSIDGPAQNAMWAAGRGAQVLRAAVGEDRQVFHAVGAWHTGHPPLRRVGKEPVELTQMLAEVVANGARPYCNVAGGVIHDRRWMEPLRAYYRWHAQNERYLGRGRTLADVGVVWAPESNWTSWSTRRRLQPGPSPSDALNGWHLALLEARIPYDVVPLFDLPTLDPQRYRTLIVPSGTEIHDASARILAHHASQAGGLILGCKTLPTSGNGGARDLLAVTGLNGTADPKGPSHNAYLAVTPDDRSDRLLADIGDTDYLAAGTWTAPADLAADGAVGLGSLRPPLPFLADRAYWTDPPDPRPILSHNGHCVYLGTDLDALYASTQMPDAGRILTNALRVASTSARRCDVNGDGLVAVHPWLIEDAVVIHLVNHTNERLYGGPLTAITPVGSQTIHLQIPERRRVLNVQFLRTNNTAKWYEDDDELRITVDHIDDFEVVAVDLEPLSKRHAGSTAGESKD